LVGMSRLVCPAERRDWYVVATKSWKEAVAADNLSNQGFRVFLPRVRRTVRHAHRTFVRLMPLFPTYLFVEASTAARWRSVNGTIGAKCIITSNDSPVAVEPGFIEALQARADREDVIDFSREFKRGDCVELAQGPFARRIGSLVDLDDRGRVTVLMEFLAACRPVHTTAANLLPA